MTVNLLAPFWRQPKKSGAWRLPKKCDGGAAGQMLHRNGEGSGPAVPCPPSRRQRHPARRRLARRPAAGSPPPAAPPPPSYPAPRQPYPVVALPAAGLPAAGPAAGPAASPRAGTRVGPAARGPPALPGAGRLTAGGAVKSSGTFSPFLIATLVNIVIGWCSSWLCRQLGWGRLLGWPG